MSPARSRPAVDDAVLDGLRQIVGRAALDDVVEVLLRTTPELCERIEHAAATGDLAELRSAAHELKGTTSNLGATRLPEMCDQLEAYSRAGDLASAKALSHWVRSEYQQVHAHLEAARQRSDGSVAASA